MLGIKFIRENKERVQTDTERKGKSIDLGRIIELDDSRKKLQQDIDALRAQQNTASSAIAQADGDEQQAMIDEVSKIKTEIQALEEQIKPVKTELDELVYQVPNILSADVPVGKDEDENVVVKTVGEKPQFDFEVRDHMELGRMHDLIDVEKAAEISGSRFAYVKNDLVMMQFALLQMTFNALTSKEVIGQIIKENNLDLDDRPFIPIIPPVMIRNEVQAGIHRVFGDQTYQFKEDGINMVASAEHTLAPYHMNETVDESRLPLRYVGYSTAFRKEAGTYGKDMGGLFRTHQFDKIELESFTNKETGEEEQKLMVGVQEYLVQQLGIPYQLVHVCTGDIGGPDYNQFDIECWLPGQDSYRETHTSDYMTDFQTRGVNSFYKGENGKHLLHTNDATAFAMGRILIAIIENYQNADGSITIPEVLRPFMGGREVIDNR